MKSVHSYYICMSLYESLINNVGIGISNINKEFIDKTLLKSDDKSLTLTYVMTKLSGIVLSKCGKAIKEVLEDKYTDRSWAYNKRVQYPFQSRSEGFTGRCTVPIYMVGVSSSLWDVVTINKDSVRVVILPGIDYKKIDKLFKKKSVVQAGNLGNFTIDYYEYKIADCKVLIEDLVNTDK